jgi:hypothetical protein
MDQLSRVKLPFVRQRTKGPDGAAGRTGEAIRVLAAGSPEGQRRRRRTILASSGAAAVCAVGFAWSASASGQRVEVLALTRPVTAGQVLGAADLVRVMVPPRIGVAVLPASQERQVVGQRAAESLWAGALLAPEALAGGDPGAGNGVLALEVREGRYPPTLAAGQVVMVYDAGSDAATSGASSSAAAPAPAPVRATVLSVSPASEGEGAAVVLVRTDVAGAAQLAVAGGPSLVQVSASGG